jgi:hypothetical protein
MTAFNSTTELFNFFRKTAIDLNCNPNFDLKQKELNAMNEKGIEGKPGCLCTAVFVQCSCPKGKKDIIEYGICGCEIFKRV